MSYLCKAALLMNGQHELRGRKRSRRYPLSISGVTTFRSVVAITPKRMLNLPPHHFNRLNPPSPKEPHITATHLPNRDFITLQIFPFNLTAYPTPCPLFSPTTLESTTLPHVVWSPYSLIARHTLTILSGPKGTKFGIENMNK